jgi:nitric-oxide synthase, bacterial
MRDRNELPGGVSVALNQRNTPQDSRWPPRGGGSRTRARLDALPARRPLAVDDPSAVGALHASAREFITLFHAENRAGPPDRRLWHVRREIETTGTYGHTPEELAFGARVAWRNSARCIGRRYWSSLEVRDRREIAAAPEVAAECIEHLREATNGGRIRPMITIFAPDQPDWPGPRILSAQIVRYAGHETADGAVLGDPANVDVTRIARHLGWSGGRPASRFDVLPLIVEEAGDVPTLHELPADAVLEVMIRHPDFAWFAGLGLRWYAVPVISDMYLDIGGVRYPAAPFNGWYMGTEIGSRDLGGAGRYDQLPVIARQLGLATDQDPGLWKHRAMTELNLAVLHSFSASGVTISDHHTEAAGGMHPEEGHDRAHPADQTPNLYRHPAPAQFIGLPAANSRATVSPAYRHSPPSVADAPLIGAAEGWFME